MQQALKILQVAATDLHAEIQDELQKNPTLEELPADDILSLDAPEVPPQTGPTQAAESSEIAAVLAAPEADDSAAPELDFPKQADPLGGDVAQPPASYSSQDAERREHFFNSLVAPPPSLQEHLAGQAALADLPHTQAEALHYLIGVVDERGWLSQSLEEAAQQSGCALSDIEAAAAVLRGFDPPGVGAQSLAECLLLQLGAKERENAQTPDGNSLAARIIAQHFELLTRRHIPELARKLGAPPETVRQAIEVISKLDPAPGRRFAVDDNRIIEPDIEVFKTPDGQWHLSLSRRYIPRLRISGTYRELIAKGSLAPEERDYLRERMQSGRALIDAIEQRQHTVERLARELLTRQRDFFEKGPAHLHPLTMTQVAEKLGVHETTISRAAANKFIKTPHGLFPLRHFFTSGYRDESGGEIANTSVKELIADWIAAEDKAAPLSDQAILEKLQTRGLSLARRTVTKYREELGLPPSSQRKQW